MTRIRFVAALPDGGAFVNIDVSSNYTEQVLRVNVRGQVIQHVHQCVVCHNIGGLLVLNNNLYVIYNNGTLVEININNTNTVQVYQVPNVSEIRHHGSLSYHPSVITHPDLLLLVDVYKDEIFSYNVTSKNKQVHLTNLTNPISVSFMTYNSQLYYVVCQTLKVFIYNSTWGLYKTLGWFDGLLSFPISAIGLPDGSVIIADFGNHRVSLFNIQGRFIRHILTRSDGLLYPRDMSISLPYLYLIDKEAFFSNRTHTYFSNYLYRYKLY